MKSPTKQIFKKDMKYTHKKDHNYSNRLNRDIKILILKNTPSLITTYINKMLCENNAALRRCSITVSKGKAQRINFQDNLKFTFFIAFTPFIGWVTNFKILSSHFWTKWDGSFGSKDLLSCIWPNSARINIERLSSHLEMKH